MDLLVTVIQRPAINDVRGHAAHSGTGQRAGSHSSRSTGADRVYERAAILRKAITERSRDRAGIRMFDHCDSRIPSLEAIHIGRLFGSSRMQATRFAAIFNIDTEDKPAVRLVLAARATIGGREYAQTREDDRIGRGRTRLRSADLGIIRVTET